jgi:uncharacterized repeat protein (TIGR03803 family)
VTPSGTLTILHSFAGQSDGAYPFAGLAEGADGNLYGTTFLGGANNYGTVFKLTTNGALITLVSFGGSGGAYSRAGLVQGTDGSFYGTTQGGGASGRGTVFKLGTDGALTTLISFNGANGANPSAGLVQGPAGNFYGTTRGGGAYTNTSGSGYGTVFALTPDGILTTLVSFNGTNGANPYAGLVQGADGSFYGTTANGGSADSGTIYRLSIVAPPALQLAAQTGGTFMLTWNATAGQAYQVQYKADMNQTNWLNLGTLITATNATASASDAIGPNPQRFYRVMLSP